MLLLFLESYTLIQKLYFKSILRLKADQQFHVYSAFNTKDYIMNNVFVLHSTALLTYTVSLSQKLRIDNHHTSKLYRQSLYFTELQLQDN